MIHVSAVEVLALKKLALVSHALGQMLSDPFAAKEQRALTQVLVDVAGRAGRAGKFDPDLLALQTAKKIEAIPPDWPQARKTAHAQVLIRDALRGEGEQLGTCQRPNNGATDVEA